MTDGQTCVDCARLRVREPPGKVKWCSGDDRFRCHEHRRMFLERMGVGQPATPVPPSAGSQGAMGL